MVGGGDGQPDVHEGGHREPPRGGDGSEAAQPEGRTGAGENPSSIQTVII